jgi:DNA processing protein
VTAAGVEACDQCLRRAWLVAGLSAGIERALGRSPSRRAQELLALPDDELTAAVAGGEHASVSERARARDPGRLRAAVAGARAWARCRHHEAFPGGLGRLADAPPVLFGRGDPALLTSLVSDGCVTVVGARRPSSYGRELATLLGRELGSARLCLVSGMALGIDSCAHEGALEAGGFTVAVLGSGPDVPHPVRMRRLYERIVEHGLVLSELPPGTGPRRWTFPARNRIMAALSAMTVVVEGRERSGSLITAALAVEAGREVGAVPGRVGAATASGPNQLLRDGAHVIRGGQDVLDAMVGVGVPVASGPIGTRATALPPELTAVLDEVERGAATQDAVARASGLDAGPVAAALARLELAGLLSCDLAGRYTRTALAVDGRGRGRPD